MCGRVVVGGVGKCVGVYCGKVWGRHQTGCGRQCGVVQRWGSLQGPSSGGVACGSVWYVGG